MEFFVPPEHAERWYHYWCQERLGWYVGLGIPAEKLRLRAHSADELSHYSSGTSDIEFAFPWGWGELEGVANRGDYDLSQHSRHSGVKLDYHEPTSGRRYTPHVIEPAAGATRAAFAFLIAAYDEDHVGGESRTVLRLDPRLAPYQVAVLPLSKDPSLLDAAEGVLGTLQAYFMCDFDTTQSIGRRYRRQDEIGTPACVTVDFATLEDGQVTIRDRDTTAQERVAIGDLAWNLHQRLLRPWPQTTTGSREPQR